MTPEFYVSIFYFVLAFTAIKALYNLFFRGELRVEDVVLSTAVVVYGLSIGAFPVVTTPAYEGALATLKQTEQALMMAKNVFGGWAHNAMGLEAVAGYGAVIARAVAPIVAGTAGGVVSVIAGFMGITGLIADYLGAQFSALASKLSYVANIVITLRGIVEVASLAAAVAVASMPIYAMVRPSALKYPLSFVLAYAALTLALSTMQPLEPPEGPIADFTAVSYGYVNFTGGPFVLVWTPRGYGDKFYLHVVDEAVPFLVFGNGTWYDLQGVWWRDIKVARPYNVTFVPKRARYNTTQFEANGTSMRLPPLRAGVDFSNLYGVNLLVNITVPSVYFGDMSYAVDLEAWKPESLSGRTLRWHYKLDCICTAQEFAERFIQNASELANEEYLVARVALAKLPDRESTIVLRGNFGSDRSICDYGGEVSGTVARRYDGWLGSRDVSYFSVAYINASQLANITEDPRKAKVSAFAAFREAAREMPRRLARYLNATADQYTIEAMLTQNSECWVCSWWENETCISWTTVPIRRWAEVEILITPVEDVLPKVFYFYPPPWAWPELKPGLGLVVGSCEMLGSCNATAVGRMALSVMPGLYCTMPQIFFTPFGFRIDNWPKCFMPTELVHAPPLLPFYVATNALLESLFGSYKYVYTWILRLQVFATVALLNVAFALAMASAVMSAILLSYERALKHLGLKEMLKEAVHEPLVSFKPLLDRTVETAVYRTFAALEAQQAASTVMQRALSPHAAALAVPYLAYKLYAMSPLEFYSRLVAFAASYTNFVKLKQPERLEKALGAFVEFAFTRFEPSGGLKGAIYWIVQGILTLRPDLVIIRMLVPRYSIPAGPEKDLVELYVGNMPVPAKAKVDITHILKIKAAREGLLIPPGIEIEVKGRRISFTEMEIRRLFKIVPAEKYYRVYFNYPRLLWEHYDRLPELAKRLLATRAHVPFSDLAELKPRAYADLKTAYRILRAVGASEDRKLAEAIASILAKHDRIEDAERELRANAVMVDLKRVLKEEYIDTLMARLDTRIRAAAMVKSEKDLEYITPGGLEALASFAPDFAKALHAVLATHESFMQYRYTLAMVRLKQNIDAVRARYGDAERGLAEILSGVDPPGLRRVAEDIRLIAAGVLTPRDLLKIASESGVKEPLGGVELLPPQLAPASRIDVVNIALQGRDKSAKELYRDLSDDVVRRIDVDPVIKEAYELLKREGYLGDLDVWRLTAAVLLAQRHDDIALAALLYAWQVHDPDAAVDFVKKAEWLKNEPVVIPALREPVDDISMYLFGDYFEAKSVGVKYYEMFQMKDHVEDLVNAAEKIAQTRRPWEVFEASAAAAKHFAGEVMHNPEVLKAVGPSDLPALIYAFRVVKDEEIRGEIVRKIAEMYPYVSLDVVEDALGVGRGELAKYAKVERPEEPKAGQVEVVAGQKAGEQLQNTGQGDVQQKVEVVQKVVEQNVVSGQSVDLGQREEVRDVKREVAEWLLAAGVPAAAVADASYSSRSAEELVREVAKRLGFNSEKVVDERQLAYAYKAYQSLRRGGLEDVDRDALLEAAAGAKDERDAAVRYLAKTLKQYGFKQGEIAELYERFEKEGVSALNDVINKRLSSKK